MTGAIVVVGSLNEDLVTRVAAAPGPGVTVHGSDLLKSPGGKGLNQAGAAGRLARGAAVHMIGRVGDDASGTLLRDSLAGAGVDVSGVLVSSGRPSGIAIIVVEPTGQNRIIVTRGANADLTPDDVDRGLDGLPSQPYVLLLQLESPIAAVERAASHARRRGATVILDPAPAPGPEGLPGSLLRHVDVLTPNESEALALLGERGHDVSLADAPDVAERLRVRTGVQAVVLKMGPKGAWIRTADGSGHVAAPEVTAVDTTAAGDTFNGALAVAITERAYSGAPAAERVVVLEAAVEFASGAAAISVTREGALGSVPTREEVDALAERTKPR